MNSEGRGRLEAALQNVGQLPTLPLVYSRLQKVLADPRVSARQVSTVIEQDQSLVSKMLRIVNSVYYSFPRKISTVSQAVVILGFNEVKHLALSISILNAFDKSPDNTGFDQVEFWRHCLGVAICSGLLAKKAGAAKCGSHEEAFVAGLLHDIGKLVEHQYMHQLFQAVLQKRQAEDLLLYDAEKSCLGFTHEETGEYLIESWKLPLPLVAVTGFHHTPLTKKSNTSLFSLISIIHIADIIVRSLGLGSGGDPFVPPLNIECWKQIGLEVDSLENITLETEQSFKEMVHFLIPEQQKKDAKL